MFFNKKESFLDRIAIRKEEVWEVRFLTIHMNVSTCTSLHTSYFQSLGEATNFIQKQEDLAGKKGSMYLFNLTSLCRVIKETPYFIERYV